MKVCRFGDWGAYFAIAAAVYGAAVFQAHADCDTKDLNEGKSSPFAHMPIFDQDGSGSCYAHAAAGIMNYELLKEGRSPDMLVNPVQAAWVEKYEDAIIGSKGLDSGEAGNVINSLKNKGFCPDRVSKYLLRTFKVGCAKSMSDAELIHLLETLYDNYSSFSLHSYSNAVAETKKAAKAKGGFVTDCQIDAVAGELKVKGLMNVAATQLLDSMFKTCTRHPTKVPAPQVYDFGGDDKILAKIDESLEHGFPLSIGICANMFKDPKYKLKGYSPPIWRASNGNLPSDCGNHEVMITGRKTLDGACKYLVRNSWGAYWRPKATNQCACRLKNGDYKDLCTYADDVQEFVGCWFDQAVIKRNVTSATTFYKP